MIDSSNQAGSSGLATALRDRSSCTMPNQPNRSLPVRPAPHTPCRGTLSRRSLQSPSLQSTNKMESAEQEPTQSVSTSSNRLLQDPTVGLIRIEVPNWQNDIRQPYINIVNLSAVHSHSSDTQTHRSVKRKSSEVDNSVSTTNCLIDISHSPDRSDISKLDSPSPLSNVDSPRNLHIEDNSPTKKRRKRKLRKEEERVEINLEVQPSKIVPPLRLKKIQSLQEDVSSCATSWGNPKQPEEPPEAIPGFRFYQPRVEEPEVLNDSSTYRIVSGTTPPYDECIDSSTIGKLPDASQDQKDERLKCKQNKLKLQLRDLKKKTLELGREMLRTAMTSPDNSVQETIVSYEEQIKKLTSLLKKLPETAARLDADCQSEDIPGPTVTSTISTALQSSPSSSIRSAYSPEPPKLSPKVPMDFENSAIVNDIRSTPPVLAKATLSHGEDTEESWREFEGLRGLLKISKKDKQRKNAEKSVVASSVITTTSDNPLHREIDLDSKSEIDLGLTDITEPVIDAAKLRDQVKAIRIKSLMERGVDEVIKIDLRKTPSPGEMVIDTTSVLQESVPEVPRAESVHLEDTLTIQRSQQSSLNITTPAPLISASAEAPKQPTHSLEECLNVNNPKDLMIADQFPTLGNWLARMSTKIPNETAKNVSQKKQTEQIIIESRTPAYQASVQAYSQANGKSTVIDLTTNGSGPRGNGSQWREERWEGQEQRNQQPAQEYLNGSGGMGGVQLALQHQNQQMTQEYCPPSVPLGRYYPRNYPMEPYGLPYAYNHPSLAATAATLWSGALLQYPFLRPRGVPQGYQPRFPGSVIQYSMSAGGMPQSRAPPPPYPISAQSQAPHPPPTPKRAQLMPEMSRIGSSNFDPNVYTKRAEYPAVPNSQNGPGYSNQRAQPQLPMDQYQKYPEANARLSVSEAQRDQMAYRQGWRGPVMPSGALGMRNYPVNSNWTSDPCSLLAALSPAALQNYSAPMPLVRVRNTKETGDQGRSCETPHLGKVNCSPNTARTLECSNCALPGPMFKCLGCEVAFYCDETCQTRHWSRHVVSCPKKMPKLKKVVP